MHMQMLDARQVKIRDVEDQVGGARKELVVMPALPKHSLVCSVVHQRRRLGWCTKPHGFPAHKFNAVLPAMLLTLRWVVGKCSCRH
jgi:hypothetical protein